MTSAADWSGRVGEVWAEEWRRTERTFAGLEPLLEATILNLAPERGRLIDIGCGVGSTGLAVARSRPKAEVIGVDLSGPMIEVAQARYALERLSHAQMLADPTGLTRWHDPGSLDFVVGDVLEVANARATFDLLFSRHGVMFFPDPVAAFAMLRRAAAPRAPLVFSCFAPSADNPWAELLGPSEPVTGYVPGPFAFADTARVREVLAAAGWNAPEHRRADYTYLAGDGHDCVNQATALFTRIGPAARLLASAAPDDRSAMRESLLIAVERYRTGDTVAFPAAAWIWTARA